MERQLGKSRVEPRELVPQQWIETRLHVATTPASTRQNLCDHVRGQPRIQQSADAADRLDVGFVVAALPGTRPRGREQILLFVIAQQSRADTGSCRDSPDRQCQNKVGALADAVKAGKVRAVGLSEVTAEQVDAAREVMPVTAVQNHDNLVDRAHEDVLDATGKHDTAFVPFFPLSFDADAVPALADVAREVGTTSGDHVRENVEALDIELSADLLARLTP